MDAPTRVALQTLGNTGWIIHNYNKGDVEIKFTAEGSDSGKLVEKLSGEKITGQGKKLSIKLKPRSRKWLKLDSK